MPDVSDPKAHAHPFKKRGRRADEDAADRRSRVGPGGGGSYAELAVTSNFTFLTGASHPDELVARAAAVGQAAMALTDRNSLAGVVRAHVAAKEIGLGLVVGCRLVFDEPGLPPVRVYPTDRASYGRLCRLLTLGKRRAEKGGCCLRLEDLLDHQEGLLAVVGPMGDPVFDEATAAGDRGAPDDAVRVLGDLRDAFDDDRLSLAVTRLYEPGERRRWAAARAWSRRYGIPLVAVNDVHYHVPERRALQDVLTCIRRGCTIEQAGFELFANGERYLKSPGQMLRLFADCPEAVARSAVVADRARGFSLDALRYEYPVETCPAGVTPMEQLRRLTWAGARWRYPAGVSEKVCGQIEHEFALIEELNYAAYFLTVHDLVRFARSRGILCQGRGAAANSAVCFCLGVTSVDPDRIDVLFERFVSRERNEPPDIDIDFEHERREEVIQYIYEKYGRDRAALTAEVITYRRRSAVRDVGKALGLSLDAVDRIAKRTDRWEKNPFADSASGDVPAQLAALGFDPSDRTMRRLIELVGEILGFPRHLSQHVGGFVITRGLLSELVPIENASMPDRTVIEWDKDDIDAMGMLKVDVLGLGMLTCIRKGLELIERHHGRTLSLATIPAEAPEVYEMIRRADTLGVFQIESRAQMTMLPRLKPRCFYDLVVEVAIVRPGPIVGQMVHPYLRRRSGQEKPDYPDETVRQVLGKTLGVPIFQEQVMALAMRAAGFTAGEAEQLRRAITAWTSKEKVVRYTSRFLRGMIANGYSPEFARWCFERMKGFSQYGFPESHAASFALLVYASAWIKCHDPAAFAAALLNSQPMGFYQPAQIVRDARDHGVAVRPVDVNHSAWNCTLEDGGTALRLGMRLVKGLGRAEAERVVQAVERVGPFGSPFELQRASGASRSTLETLGRADAFSSMKLGRRRALWAVRRLPDEPLPCLAGVDGAAETDEPCLPGMGEAEEVARDYQMVGLSLKCHPLAFLRDRLTRMGTTTAAVVKDERRCRHGREVSVAGVVLFRQRPGTAKGVMFMTIEDETGRVDLIVRPKVYEQYREAAVYGRIVWALGKVERQGRVVHVLVRRMENLEHWAAELPGLSRDFR